MSHPWPSAGTVYLEQDRKEDGGELRGKSLPLLIFSLHCVASKSRREQALHWSSCSTLLPDFVPEYVSCFSVYA